MRHKRPVVRSRSVGPGKARTQILFNSLYLRYSGSLSNSYVILWITNDDMNRHRTLRTVLIGTWEVRCLNRPQQGYSEDRWFRVYLRIFSQLPWISNNASWPATGPQTSIARSLHIAIYCFLFKFPVFSRFLNVIQSPSTSSSSPSRHFYPFFCLSFNNEF